MARMEEGAGLARRESERVFLQEACRERMPALGPRLRHRLLTLCPRRECSCPQPGLLAAVSVALPTPDNCARGLATTRTTRTRPAASAAAGVALPAELAKKRGGCVEGGEGDEHRHRRSAEPDHCH